MYNTFISRYRKISLALMFFFCIGIFLPCLALATCRPGHEGPPEGGSASTTTSSGETVTEEPKPTIPKEELIETIFGIGEETTPTRPITERPTPTETTETPVVTVPESECCEFTSLSIRNVWRENQDIEVIVAGQSRIIHPNSTHTFSGNLGESVRITVKSTDPAQAHLLIEDVPVYCKNLKKGIYPRFYSIRIVNFTSKPKKPCPGTGVPAPVEEPSRPRPVVTTPPKKPPVVTTPPKKPPVVTTPTPEFPTPTEEEECDCEFFDKQWFPYKTIEAAYVYIPPPRRDVKIPLRGKVELKAQGADQDTLRVRSLRTVNGKLDCMGAQNVRMPDSMQYLWRISQGPGNFNNGQRQDDGEAVIYLPPFGLPFGEHRVIIETVVDDIAGKADDDRNEGRIEMNIKHRQDDPDYYYIDFNIIDFSPVRVIKEPPTTKCACEITTSWSEGGTIEHEIIKPPSPYAICCDDTDVWIAFGRDMDDLFVNCYDKDCGSDGRKIPLPDVLTHSWYAKYGNYLDGITGRKVLYKAPHIAPPEPAPQEFITLKTEDSRQQYPDKEPEKKERRITIVSLDLDINIDDKPRDGHGIPIVSQAADITDADDEKEESRGGYIWPNDDNDHQVANDAVIDKDDQNYAGENDLEPILYKISESVWEAGLAVEIEMTSLQGNLDNLKIWQEQRKEHQIQLAGGKAAFHTKEELDADTDGLLYLEGIDQGIFKIFMRIKDGERIVCEDIIKVTVFSPVHIDWESNGDTSVTRDSPAPPPGQTRDGKRIFPDHQTAADAAVRDQPKLAVRFQPDIPEGANWALPLYVKVFDVDHYHDDINFDPNGARQPDDNRTGYTSSAEAGDAYNIGMAVDHGSVEYVINENANELRFAQRIEGNPTTPQDEAILDLTHHTPCNNWRIAVGSGNNMHEAVRINTDAADPANGATLEYINDTALNISAISGPGHTTSQSTETLTVWRKLYIEQDHMAAVNFNEGPEDMRSTRAGVVTATGANSVSVQLGIARENQFQGGQANFFQMNMLLFVPLGTVAITGNTAGGAPTTINLAAAPPAGSQYALILDDDVVPAAGVTIFNPHIQPQVPPVDLFNHAEGFPGACIEADFDTLNGNDTNNAAFELNVDNENGSISGSKGIQGGDLFWVSTSFGGYQYRFGDSNDPNWPASGVMWGISTPYWVAPPAAATGGAITFFEAIRDWTTYQPSSAADTQATRLARVNLHEIGHTMGGRHGDAGLMAAGDAGTGPAGGMFTPTTWRRFMLIHDTGPSRQ